MFVGEEIPTKVNAPAPCSHNESIMMAPMRAAMCPTRRPPMTTYKIIHSNKTGLMTVSLGTLWRVKLTQVSLKILALDLIDCSSVSDNRKDAFSESLFTQYHLLIGQFTR